MLHLPFAPIGTNGKQSWKSVNWLHLHKRVHSILAFRNLVGSVKTSHLAVCIALGLFGVPGLDANGIAMYYCVITADTDVTVPDVKN